MSTTTRPPEINSGVLTTWLPLSTAWPAVPQCSSQIYSQIGSGGGQIAIGFDPYFGIYINTQTSCLPPYATSWWNQERHIPPQTVTSIGPIVCPELYTTAHTSVVNSLSTFVACCPSAYRFQQIEGPGTINQCNSPLTRGQVFTYQSATASGDWFQASTTITVTDASVFGVHMNGYIFGTTSSSSSISSTSSSSIPITSSSPSIPTSPIGVTSSTSAPPTSLPTSSASSGLSSGAKAGIGVGVALGFVGVLSLFLAWFLIRKHRRKAEYTVELDAGAGPLPPKPASAEGGYSSMAASELPATGGYNEPSRSPPVELAGESR